MAKSILEHKIEQTRMKINKVPTQIKCTNIECEDNAKYNGFTTMLRFYKCPTCGKVTTINKKTGQILLRGERVRI